MTIINVNKELFNSEINEGLVIVDFWAPWCGPCKMLSPVLEELNTLKGENLKILKVNVDENQELANEFEIMSIPTILYFKDGTLLAKDTGFKPLEYFTEKVDGFLK